MSFNIFNEYLCRLKKCHEELEEHKRLLLEKEKEYNAILLKSREQTLNTMCLVKTKAGGYCRLSANCQYHSK